MKTNAGECSKAVLNPHKFLSPGRILIRRRQDHPFRLPTASNTPPIAPSANTCNPLHGQQCPLRGLFLPRLAFPFGRFGVGRVLHGEASVGGATTILEIHPMPTFRRSGGAQDLCQGGNVKGQQIFRGFLVAPKSTQIGTFAQCGQSTHHAQRVALPTFLRIKKVRFGLSDTSVFKTQLIRSIDGAAHLDQHGTKVYCVSIAAKFRYVLATQKKGGMRSVWFGGGLIFSFHLFICSSVRLFVCSSVRLFVFFVCTSVRLFVFFFQIKSIPFKCTMATSKRKTFS